MIATVQNTKRTLTYKGKQKVEVWEARSQAGTRFHLFVVGAQLMPGQQSIVKTTGGKEVDLTKSRFDDDLADQKIPAAETAKLPDAIE